MKKHKLTLLGGPHNGLRVSASVLTEAIDTLIEGARLATRFAVEGTSTRPGKSPVWLEAACAMEITGLTAGSAVLAVESPMLGVADKSIFGVAGQTLLFDDHTTTLSDLSAIDLYGELLGAIAEDNVERVNADRALLENCARFAKLSERGTRLEGIHGRHEPIELSRAHAPRIEALRDNTPPDQAARVAGKLETISASKSNITLLLADGSTLRARMEEHDPDALQQLFGEQVVVSGVASYHPSGELRMLAVESLAPARSADRLFEATPRPQLARPIAVRAAQDATTGVSAFFGTWPGDETELELLTALRAIG